ncbi:hypothetical protein JCM21714_1456 [Gracilibacillus boraciitolerans JCM 21714]|uniref:Uncharacterized protein n=1 Tax=Gracilibacillus boraciitolerans JCM 21714 TaxID=1298598 RepID=W4VI24_9BACI|nr:hypothetical protein [Gracilibacillus boraciitolerans]GAE92453.1 hypothetical protein JCM21714_1456 [Gracilibacillus boraciitolerans JCM 21714]
MKTNLVRKELLEANLKKGEIENELYNVSLENKLLRNLDRSHAIASEMVDLNNANVYCQNQHLNKEVTMKQQSQEIVFRLSNIKAPKKKDYTIVEITLDVIKKKENMVSFVLHNSYQKPRNKGRIQYSVILEGKKIHKEDIALSNKENFFNLKLTPKKNQITLRIKLEAMKNCESWSWGSASRTKFYGLRIWTESANENDYSIITQTLKRI